MADEERAPETGETIVTPEVEEQPGEPLSVEALAAELGWKPEDQWKGDAGKWQPADQYLRTGRESRSSLNREMKSLRDQVDRISRTSAELAEGVRERTIAERDAYWQGQLDKAVKDDNPELARKAAGEIAKVATEREKVREAPANDMPPDTAAFVERNKEWFGTPTGTGFVGGDPLARARVIEICERLAKQGLTPDEQLQQAERAVRKEYPELFKQPGKQAPGVQTAQSRTNTSGGSRDRGYADMPLESRQMADDYERRLGIKKDDFARSYWKERAKQERKVA